MSKKTSDDVVVNHPTHPDHPSNKKAGDEPVLVANQINQIENSKIMVLCPNEFDEANQAIWLEVCEAVGEAGQLVAKNLLRIREIVSIIRFKREAELEVATDGLTWKTEGRNGLQKKPHWLLPTISAYNRDISSFCAAFGLDPVSEKRLIDPRQTDMFEGEGW